MRVLKFEKKTLSLHIGNLDFHYSSVSYLLLDNEIDRKIDVTAIQSVLVENRQQTHDLTLIGSGANGIGIQVCWACYRKTAHIE